MSHFNQQNIERNNCVWTTKYKRLSEMCIFRNVETKSVFTFQPTKTTSFYDCKTCKAFWNVLSIPFRDKNQQLCCLSVTVHIVFQERRVATTEKRSHLDIWRNFSANHNQAHPNLNQKRLKWVQIWSKRIGFLLAGDLSDIFIFQIILFNFNLQSTATQLTFNLQKLMIFSVSNDGIQWSLVFGPDSLTIAGNDI